MTPRASPTKRTHAANGTVVEYAYDHRNRLTGQTLKDSLGAVTKSVAYTCDGTNEVHELYLNDRVRKKGSGRMAFT